MLIFPTLKVFNHIKKNSSLKLHNEGMQGYRRHFWTGTPQLFPILPPVTAYQINRTDEKQ